MKVSPACIALIKQFEGLRTDAYLDSCGVCTIGFGHIEGVELGQSIDVRIGGEGGALARAFNSTAASLARVERQRKQLVRGVALHEPARAPVVRGPDQVHRPPLHLWLTAASSRRRGSLP